MAKTLYIYFIERISPYDYDEYDAAVITALSYDDAKKCFGEAGATGPDDLTVKRVGVATDGFNEPLILQSFNAG